MKAKIMEWVLVGGGCEDDSSAKGELVIVYLYLHICICVLVFVYLYAYLYVCICKSCSGWVEAAARTIPPQKEDQDG